MRIKIKLDSNFDFWNRRWTDPLKPFKPSKAPNPDYTFVSQITTLHKKKTEVYVHAHNAVR